MKHLTEQYQCQSYYDDNNELQDCTCGKCDIDAAQDCYECKKCDSLQQHLDECLSDKAISSWRKIEEIINKHEILDN